MFLEVCECSKSLKALIFFIYLTCLPLAKLRLMAYVLQMSKKGSKENKNSRVNYAIRFLILHGFIRKRSYISGKIFGLRNVTKIF